MLPVVGHVLGLRETFALNPSLRRSKREKSETFVTVSY